MTKSGKETRRAQHRKRTGGNIAPGGIIYIYIYLLRAPAQTKRGVETKNQKKRRRGCAEQAGPAAFHGNLQRYIFILFFSSSSPPPEPVSAQKGPFLKIIDATSKRILDGGLNPGRRAGNSFQLAGNASREKKKNSGCKKKIKSAEASGKRGPIECVG